MYPISFPGLGLEFNINPIAFWLFGKAIYWYGIIVACTFFICYVLAQKSAEKYGISKDNIADFILLAVPISVIGARFYYVLFNWKDYAENVWEIFAIWHGGIAIYGAIIASVAVGYFYTKAKKIKSLAFFDFFSPFLVLGQAIGRWGNFVNQEAYGIKTSVLWRMEVTDPNTLARISVHPTFFYESIWNLCLFVFLSWYYKKNKRDGNVFLLYLIFYSSGRFFIEGLRADSLMLGSFKVSQLLAAILVIMISSIFFIMNRPKMTDKANFHS
jgi:phosphatidylglycerol:prolipoprotein diacylglycerol transferase